MVNLFIPKAVKKAVEEILDGRAVLLNLPLQLPTKPSFSFNRE